MRFIRRLREKPESLTLSGPLHSSCSRETVQNLAQTAFEDGRFSQSSLPLTSFFVHKAFFGLEPPLLKQRDKPAKWRLQERDSGQGSSIAARFFAVQLGIMG